MTKTSANFLKVYIFTLAPSCKPLNSYLYFYLISMVLLFPLLHLNSCMELGFFSLVWSQTTYHMPLCVHIRVYQKSFSHLRNTNSLNLKVTNSSFKCCSAPLTRNLSLATFFCKLKYFYMLFVCLGPIHPTYFSLPTWIPEYMCTSLAEKLGLFLFLCLVTVRIFGTHLSCQNLPLKVFFLRQFLIQDGF